MFGPDKCGQTDKVHFIFNRKSEKTGEYVEHHLLSTIEVRVDQKTHLYTLHIKSDNTYFIYMDLDLVISGSLFEVL